MKKKVVKNPKVPRTRNYNTQTESEHLNVFKSMFRKHFMYSWVPANVALDNASRPSQHPTRKLKKEYQCNHCKNWFAKDNVHIDHIEECGGFKSYDEIPDFLKRFLPEDPEAYQILCVGTKENPGCHLKKTKAYMQSKK